MCTIKILVALHVYDPVVKTETVAGMCPKAVKKTGSFN